MGDNLKKSRRRRWPAGFLAGAALAVLVGACSSAAPPQSAAPPASEARGEVSAAATSAVPAAVEIRSLELREGAPGMELAILADGPLVWTSYRNGEGHLVIELPNSVPAPAVGHLRPEEGLVEYVEVEVEEGGERSLTRLRVATRQEAEHSLESEGNSLRLRLAPVEGAAAVAVAEEPLPSEEVEEEAAVPAAARAEAAPAEAEPAAAERFLGTPEEPWRAPPPEGVPATQLQGVEIQPSETGTMIWVMGDGEFTFTTFRLEDPERFVVDLVGVVNNAPRATVELEGEVVERVRIAQFKSRPSPVSRVVFDLTQPVAPSIERGPDGLTILFGARGAPTLVETIAAPAAEAPIAEEPAAEMAEEPAAELPVDETVEVAEAPGPSRPPEEELPPEPPAVEVPPVTAEAPAPEPARPPVERAPAEARPEVTSDVALFEAAQVEGEPPAPFATQEVTPAYGSLTVGGAGKEYQGEPITMSLKDADIKDVLRSFAQISNLNIVVQPGVTGTVTVELTDVPWDQALEQILKINGLGYELEGNIMRIAPISQLRAEAEEQQRLRQAQALSIPLRTVIKRISYASAGETAAILRAGGGAGILSQRGSVIVDRRTNTLLIQELPTHMDTVLAVIENLDIPEPQVMIEARIIETTKRFTRSLGIQWGFDAIADAAHGNTTGLIFPNNLDASGSVNLLTGGSNGLLDISLGNVLNTFVLDATLQAAETEGLINILSAPKVVTLNNETAEIQSGLQIPIQTVANNTVTVQFVNATLRMNVTPHVTAEGTVLMDIQIQKREPQLAFAVVGATNAPIATKEARTRVIVRDGGTTVIGGIYEVSTDQGEDRVPGLANVPILGHLFKNRRRTDENEELLIFITPRVIKL